jgi:hypothetical protein
VCGDDPDPDINKDDVSKDKGHSLSNDITPSDGHEAVDSHLAGKKPRLLEEFETKTFEDVWPKVSGIQENVAPTSVDAAWRSIGDQLHTSALAFEKEVTRLRDAGGWEGETIKAAYTNAINSISEPFYTGTAALMGAELTHKFRDVMNYVHKNLVNDPLGEYPDMWQRYDFDINNKEYGVEGAPGQQETAYEPTTPGEKAAIKQYYDEYMRMVMNDSYKPGINAIYSHYPQYAENTAPSQPINIPGLPGKPGKPDPKNTTGDPSIGTGGGTPPHSGGGFKTPNLGTGKPLTPESLQKLTPEDVLNKTKLPGDPDKPGQNDPRHPSVTDPTKALDPNGLTSGLTNAANQALGSATQAAGQAAKASPSGLAKDLGKKPNLAEGALRLGKGGTGTGAGAGGARGGGASLGGVSSRLPGLPTAATQAESAGMARPGTGAASPAMGSPGTPGGAGHGAGAGQQNKEHKANKALRRRQNGTEIAGEAEAVVPVIGQDQGPDQGQDQQQDDAASQRGPDRPRGPSVASPPPPVPPASPDRRQLSGRG